jgi:hypothetical protein
MTDLSQQPSKQAVEMLAELMLRRLIRQSSEPVAHSTDSHSISSPVRLAEQLSLPLVVRVDK